MAVSYKKLFHRLVDLELSNVELTKKSGDHIECNNAHEKKRVCFPGQHRKDLSCSPVWG